MSAGRAAYTVFRVSVILLCLTALVVATIKRLPVFPIFSR